MEDVTKCLHVFQTSANLAQRRDAEAKMMAFMRTRDSWKIALTNIQTEREEGILFYLATVLEYWTGTVRFSSLSSMDRSQMKGQIFQFLSQRQKSLSPFVGVKFSVVLARIGKQIWLTSDDNPNFLEVLMSTAKNGDTVTMGLLLLKHFSEEIMKNSADVAFSRREELRLALKQHSPSIIRTIFDVLAECARQASDLVEPIVKACLEGLLHYFGWISPELSFEPNLTRLILDAIKKNDHSSLLAFDCINEVLDTAAIPKNRQDFLFLVFNEIFDLLKALTEVNLGKISLDFQRKFIQFCSLFVTKHLHRVESLDNFPMIPLLELIRKFTFKQRSLEGFTEILSVWRVLVSYLEQQYVSNGNEEHPRFLSYSDLFVSFAAELYSALLWTKNGKLLLELEVEADGDLQEVFDECIDLLRDIGQLYQHQVLAVFCPELTLELRSLPSRITTVSSSRGTSSSEAKVILRDAVTSLRVVAQLTEFIANHFDFPAMFQFMEALIGICGFFHSNSNFLSSSKHATAACAQALTTIASFEGPLMGIISLREQKSGESPAEAQAAALLPNLIQNLIGLSVSTLRGNFGSAMSSSAMMLLRTISKLDKTTILSHPECQSLLSSPFLRFNPSVETTEELLVLLDSLLTIPLPPKAGETSDSSQQRLQTFKTVLSNSFYGPFITAISRADFISSGEYRSERSVQEFKFALRVTEHVFKSINGFPKVSKDVNFEVFRAVIRPLLPLLRHYLPALEILESLIDTLRAFVSTFRSHLSAEDLTQIMRVLTEVAPPDQVARIVASSDSHAKSFLLKMLDMIAQLVESNSNMPSLLPSILALTRNSLLPVLGDILNPAYPVDAIESFLGLLKNLTIALLTASAEQETVDLIAIFAKCLVSNELQVVQTALTSLGELMAFLTRPSLFQSLGFPLSRTLIDAVIAGNAALYREDMLSLLYTIARLNFDQFFKSLLPQCLQAQAIDDKEKASLASNFKPETDEPSFTKQIDRFAYDCAFFISLHHQ